MNMASCHFADEDSEGGVEIVKSGGYEDEDQPNVDSDYADEPDTSGGKKNNKSQEHKSRNEDKKSKKKKKAESADPSKAEEEQSGDKPVSKKKKKTAKSTLAQSAAAPTSSIPIVEEVCSTFGLQDVKIDSNNSAYHNLNNYKLFLQHVQPLLQKENPMVSVNQWWHLQYLFIYVFIFVW